MFIRSPIPFQICRNPRWFVRDHHSHILGPHWFGHPVRWWDNTLITLLIRWDQETLNNSKRCPHKRTSLKVKNDGWCTHLYWGSLYSTLDNLIRPMPQIKFCMKPGISLNYWLTFWSLFYSFFFSSGNCFWEILTSFGEQKGKWIFPLLSQDRQGSNVTLNH